jgi:hypothetical protein
MTEQYDGYRFTPEQQEPIYNSQYVFYYLRNLYLKGEAPKNLIDSSVSDSSETVAEYLITNHKTNSNVTLQNLATGEMQPQERKYYSDMLMPAFRSKELFQEKTVEACLISLAYYHGFLTYKTDEDGHTFLSSPNLIMKTIVMDTLFSDLPIEAKKKLLSMIGKVDAVGIKTFLVTIQTAMISEVGTKFTDEGLKNLAKILAKAFGPP